MEMDESEEHHKGNKRRKTRVQSQNGKILGNKWNQHQNKEKKRTKEDQRNDKKRWAEKLAEEAQEAANLEIMKKLHKITRLTANKQLRSKKT
ncbi:hypothetical protein HHI36_022953 [Cryptolaemus montrouzieri]|uniref:Uncharacterized protein n=1 Tax=Cryptolaemus montrouzieri TaxID=559131 RepID=A0ABD2PFV4_9CUCU